MSDPMARLRSPVDVSSTTTPPPRRTLFSRLFRSNKALSSAGSFSSPLPPPAATSPPPPPPPPAMTMTHELIQGLLVKLPTHSLWQPSTRPTYFVLEEEKSSSSSSIGRIVLRQFRRPEDARRSSSTEERGLHAMQEIELSPQDVLVERCDRQAPFGIDLFHREESVAPWRTPWAARRHSAASSNSRPQEQLHLLRLSASDSTTQHLWMRVLGSAIARLSEQSESLRQKARRPSESAKVVPILPRRPQQEDDDEEEEKHTEGVDDEEETALEEEEGKKRTTIPTTPVLRSPSDVAEQGQRQQEQELVDSGLRTSQDDVMGYDLSPECDDESDASDNNNNNEDSEQPSRRRSDGTASELDDDAHDDDSNNNNQQDDHNDADPTLPLA
ncbi:hypothetical protein PINS_up011219 [Pythium insidiosum]|nr:hypothetical protein PINS_up011219 [Pythium insidiosum]